MYERGLKNSFKLSPSIYYDYANQLLSKRINGLDDIASDKMNLSVKFDLLVFLYQKN